MLQHQRGGTGEVEQEIHATSELPGKYCTPAERLGFFAEVGASELAINWY